MNQLPVEMIREIAGHLTLQERANLRLVNRSFRKALPSVALPHEVMQQLRVMLYDLVGLTVFPSIYNDIINAKQCICLPTTGITLKSSSDTMKAYLSFVSIVHNNHVVLDVVNTTPDASLQQSHNRATSQGSIGLYNSSISILLSHISLREPVIREKYRISSNSITKEFIEIGCLDVYENIYNPTIDIIEETCSYTIIEFVKAADDSDMVELLTRQDIVPLQISDIKTLLIQSVVKMMRGLTLNIDICDNMKIILERRYKKFLDIIKPIIRSKYLLTYIQIEEYLHLLLN